MELSHASSQKVTDVYPRDLSIIVLLLRDRVQVVPPTDSKSGGDKPLGPEAHCKIKEVRSKDVFIQALTSMPSRLADEQQAVMTVFSTIQHPAIKSTKHYPNSSWTG